MLSFFNIKKNDQENLLCFSSLWHHNPTVLNVQGYFINCVHLLLIVWWADQSPTNYFSMAKVKSCVLFFKYLLKIYDVFLFFHHLWNCNIYIIIFKGISFLVSGYITAIYIHFFVSTINQKTFKYKMYYIILEKLFCGANGKNS